MFLFRRSFTALTMQAENQQSWKINIQAKAKNFDFRLKVTNVSLTWKNHRLSALLKLRRFLLTVHSESSTASNGGQQQRKLTSKFLKKIFFKRTKNQPIAAKESSNRRHPEAKFSSNRLKQFAFEVKPRYLMRRAYNFFLGILLFVAFLFNKCKKLKPIKLPILLVAAALVWKTWKLFSSWLWYLL